MALEIIIQRTIGTLFWKLWTHLIHISLHHSKAPSTRAYAIYLIDSLLSGNLLSSMSPISCRKCGGCKHDIVHGNYLGCMGTFFHPECFRCFACGYPIAEHEVGPLVCFVDLHLHHQHYTLWLASVPFSLILVVIMCEGYHQFTVLLFIFNSYICFFFLYSSSLCQDKTHTISLASKSSLIQSVKSAINLYVTSFNSQ